VLWRPITQGEKVFLHLFDRVGRHVEVNDPRNLDYLVHADGMRQFVRLTATLEIFMRVIRCAAQRFSESPGGAWQDYSRSVRVEADLPDFIARDRAFAETVREAGRIASERRRLPTLEKGVINSARNQCYLCGVHFSPRIRGTADHIWPLRLAGESVEGNLLPACVHCNEKKDHAITWAWGPVQSTYEELPAGVVQPNYRLSMSLALARLMLVAGHSRPSLTLKAAAEKSWPLTQKIPMQAGPNLYFELFQRMSASVV